ncbi:hypothetical protein [Weissella coleopterorum]|nr:hypothetical protein [Weissella coleopterorum]
MEINVDKNIVLGQFVSGEADLQRSGTKQSKNNFSHTIETLYN